MKALGINPNTGKYFNDKSDYISMTDNMYQGVYSYTPVFPLYTFSSLGRVSYNNPQNEIEFYTMIPIKRLLGNYFVEIKFRFIINARNQNSLNDAITEFNKFCEMNKKKLKISTLLSQNDG